jgi:HAAS
VAALIDRYLAALERELSFDPALARRLRYEVEDHLDQASAAGGPDAERRAIERFGEPRDIAARFAASSLRRQRKALGLAVVAAIAGIFLAMKIRIAAAGLAGSAPGLAAVLAVDRYAFWFAAIAGALGWVHAVCAPAAQRFDAVCGAG